MNSLPQELSEALEQGATLITPTPQLAVALRRAWGERQQARGLTVWPTPAVHSLQGWLLREWQRALRAEADWPRLLSPAQERIVWEHLVAADGAAAGLMQPAGLARAAMRAWRIQHEWHLDASSQHIQATEETAVFARWARRFERETRRHGWLDGVRALQRLPTAHTGAQGWCAVGFDAPPPALNALIERLRACGVEARIHEPQRSSPAARALALADPDEELRAAAAWARARLAVNPAARLLVVVPDLDRRRAAVRRLFEEILRPASLGLEPAPALAPFAIEGGVPLDEYPLVQAALTALALACGRVPFEQTSRWLRSPFLFAAESQAAPRAQADLILRRLAPPELGLEALCAGLMAAGGCAFQPWIERCRTFSRLLVGGRHLPSHWSEALDQGLRTLGWPGERPLDSAEHQTLEKFHDALGELASLDELIGPVDIAGALAELRRVVKSMRFQPKTPDCPVNITARLADPVLRYDGIWITGLHAAAWPRAPRLDPLLPWQAQRAAGVPESSADSALALAKSVSARLFAGAREVIASWPRRFDEQDTLPSPLLVALPAAPALELELPSLDYRRALLRSALLEAELDERAAPLDADARTLPGGAATLRLQSQCPFRAFAEKRLRAAAPESPTPGIDAPTRGSFTHRALKLFWDRVGTQAQLAALNPVERRRRVKEALAQAAREVLAPAARWPRALIELETQRLATLLEAFLALELGRPPFRVLASEAPVETTLAGLRVRLFIDRIDELADGRRVVIDYKTGGITPKAWHGERPDDPQLPLYATVSQPPPAAAVLAFLRADGCHYKGAGAPPAALAGLDMTSEWPEQLARWRVVVERLAGEFAAGEARVDPIRRRICTYCGLQALCRIDEIDGPQPEDEDEG